MNFHSTLTAPFTADTPYDPQQMVGQRAMALLVGFVAIGLPSILYLGPKFLPGCERYSISHFYYSPFWGGIFIGMLTFIGAYLIAYKGETFWEKVAATVAGICAFGVAFLPAANHGCLERTEFRARAFANFKLDDAGVATLVSAPDAPDFFRLQDGMRVLGIEVASMHYISAMLLFSILAIFCLLVFTRTIDDRHKTGDTLKTTKRSRNWIYVTCGLVIVLSIGMLAWEFFATRGSTQINTPWNLARKTFLWEAVALYAFGTSWLVKGRLLRIFRDDIEHHELAIKSAA